MKEHKYTLQPYNGKATRHICPECNNRGKTFSLYIDAETGEQIHPAVGRCNRESKCGYHYTPKQYFQDNNISFDKPQATAAQRHLVQPKSKTISHIPVEAFKASLKEFDRNNFLTFLSNLFGAAVTSELVKLYFIATSKYWQGATVFWQIDKQGKIRTGKIMLYSPTTGKRVKEPFNHIQWVHKALKLPEFELSQCLFGEHLLIDDNKPVAIVESEKTAVIASAYLPQFIWVAVGSLTNLNADKLQILKGRSVILFPDLNGFEKWQVKAKELSHLTNIYVSDLLERKASEAEKKEGYDIADYLIQFDLNQFAEPTTALPCSIYLETAEPIFDLPTNTTRKAPSWGNQITDLERFFQNTILPTEPIMLNPFTKISNSTLFVNSHIETIKRNNGKPGFLPYLERLEIFKSIINTH